MAEEFSQYQRAVMEARYQWDEPVISAETRALSKRIGLTPIQIQTWFQDRKKSDGPDLDLMTRKERKKIKKLIQSAYDSIGDHVADGRKTRERNKRLARALETGDWKTIKERDEMARELKWSKKKIRSLPKKRKEQPKLLEPLTKEEIKKLEKTSIFKGRFNRSKEITPEECKVLAEKLEIIPRTIWKWFNTQRNMMKNLAGSYIPCPKIERLLDDVGEEAKLLIAERDAEEKRIEEERLEKERKASEDYKKQTDQFSVMEESFNNVPMDFQYSTGNGYMNGAPEPQFPANFRFRQSEVPVETQQINFSSYQQPQGLPMPPDNTLSQGYYQNGQESIFQPYQDFQNQDYGRSYPSNDYQNPNHPFSSWEAQPMNPRTDSGYSEYSNPTPPPPSTQFDHYPAQEPPQAINDPPANWNHPEPPTQEEEPWNQFYPNFKHKY